MKGMEQIDWKNIGAKKWLILGLAGILLVGSTYFGNIDDKKREQKKEVVTEKSSNYEISLQSELIDIISCVAGVGKVNVMITFKSTEEKVVKEDWEISNESKGTNSDENKANKKSTTVIIKNDGEEQPFITMENYPVIEGVAVIAEGASDANVKNNIINIIKALFEVEIHKISVTEMK